MSETPTTRIFPFLRYADAPAAFEWLARAFGFEKQMLVPGPGRHPSRTRSYATAAA